MVGWYTGWYAGWQVRGRVARHAESVCLNNQAGKEEGRHGFNSIFELTSLTESDVN